MEAQPAAASGLSVDFQLGQAAQSGDLHRLNAILLEHPAAVMNAMAKNPGRMNLVHKAAARGHAEVLRRILEVGGRHDVALPNGDRAIHLAVREGKAATLKVLLDRGADYTVKNSVGHSPIYEAIRGRQAHCFLLLVQSGADYHSYITQGKLTAQDIAHLKQDFGGMTPDQQLLLLGTLEHVDAEHGLSIEKVKSDEERHRERFMREEAVRVKELEAAQKLERETKARNQTFSTPTSRTDPYAVCAAIIAESKRDRSQLRQSLEVRCRAQSDIMQLAVEHKYTKAVDEAKAKAKQQAKVNSVHDQLAREARLDKLEGLTSPSSRSRYAGTAGHRSARASRTMSAGSTVSSSLSLGTSLASSPRSSPRSGLRSSPSGVGASVTASRSPRAGLSTFPPSMVSPRPLSSRLSTSMTTGSASLY